MIKSDKRMGVSQLLGARARTAPQVYAYARKRFISDPRSRLKNTSNFSWMTEILLMNLNVIELLTISQLITIRNSSDGNNNHKQ